MARVGAELGRRAVTDERDRAHDRIVERPLLRDERRVMGEPEREHHRGHERDRARARVVARHADRHVRSPPTQQRAAGPGQEQHRQYVEDHSGDDPPDERLRRAGGRQRVQQEAVDDRQDGECRPQPGAALAPA